MAGHSEYANIKHKKDRIDAKRSKIFTKIGRDIMVAARSGGSIEFNASLRMAVDKAKAVNMPKENIERAIKKGTGELASEEYFEIKYEGYGPGGVAVVVEALTDNKNRTAGAVRATFSKNGGNLGETGSVGWIFERKGVILIPASSTTEEQLMDIALEAGADDIQQGDEFFTVTTAFEDFENVKKSLESNNLVLESAEIAMIPKNTVTVTDEEIAASLLKLIETLEDNDDVQEVAANFDISPALLEKLSK